MKTINFIDLYKYEYTIENIACKLYWEENETYNFLQQGRLSNALMFFSGIETTHTFTDKTINFEINDLCYFPMGIKYHSVFTKCQKDKNGYNGVILNFHIIDKNGYNIRLSDDIIMLSELLNLPYENELYEIVNLLRLNKPIMLIKSKIYELLTDISLRLNERCVPDQYQKISEGVKYIESNFDKNINIKKISEHCLLSESHFRKLFRSYYGISPIKYINNLKIKKANSLLKSGVYSIAEVGEEIGIDDPSYFSYFYKKHTGQNPRSVK